MTEAQEKSLFGSLDGDLEPTEVESLCMSCGENGITRLLLTVIPHFREVILMAFECPHCGLRNNEIQSGSSIAEQGMIQTLKIQNQRDLSRQIVKSETAAIKLMELDFEIPAGTQRGVLSTIEGILDRAIDGLSQEQPVRKAMDLALHDQVENVISQLRSYMSGETFPWTLVLDDPAGNSYIENFCAPKPDPQINIKHYKRSKEQDEFLCLAAPDESAKEAPVEEGITEDAPAEQGITKDDLAFKEEIHSFPGNCSRCNVPCETKMHMLEIPHFKEVIIMATSCDACGYKSNEVKSGGAISPKGKRITLKMTDTEDLSRDILKSETCGLSIPEIDLELTPGTLGGRFTTVEGLISQVRDELSERAPFIRGDSATESSKSSMDRFLAKLDKVLAMEVTPVTLILDDPLANSYLQNTYAPDPDPNMTVEEYERTWDQNEAYGLNDIHLENDAIYEEGEEEA